MLRSRILRIAIVAAALFHASVGHAANAADEERADERFNYGVEQMAAKNFDAACPALAESYALDPKPGVLFTLAFCEHGGGKLLSSREHFDNFLSMYDAMPEKLQLKFQDRMKIAKEKLSLLEKETPRLTLTLASTAPTGTRVFLNEKEIESASFGQPLAFDPGEYVVRADAPGREPRPEKLELARKDRKAHEVQVSGPKPPGPEPRSVIQGRQKAAIIIGGVGVAGLVGWGVTGGGALAQKRTYDACEESGCSPQDRKAMRANGQMLGNWATVGLSVGLAGVATGAILWFTGRKSIEENAPKAVMQVEVVQVGTDGAVVGLRGSF